MGILSLNTLTHFFKNDDINTIIDKQNKFIAITCNIEKYKCKVKFLDSYRIFPVKLQSLCEIFGYSGKSMEYSNEFRDISLFYNPEVFDKFKEYSIRDSVCLHEALSDAQHEYWVNYRVDITTIVSASSLAFKIFRTKYLKVNIPMPYPEEDAFIRKSYFGGATDIYKATGKNLHYIDVNSLYPYAMLNKIPLDFIRFIKDMSTFSLKDFFGFVKVEVTCPNNLARPVLPHKFRGKTIFPVGTWVGTYFSEELKAVNKLNLGYEFKLISGYEFKGVKLFDKYISAIYKIKQESKGSERFIAKLLLNTLYGVFGRRMESSEVIVINNNDEDKYLHSRFVLSSIPLDEGRTALIIQNNILPETLRELNITFETNIADKWQDVNSNIAIASAVTAYARIHMMPFKLHDSCYYTDTDSVFVDTLEPFKHLLGKELGLFKDELDGLVIQEAEFLGIKQYGYWYIDKTGTRQEQSVFAGVSRNSIPFVDIQRLQAGETLTITGKDRFYKSLVNLEISIENHNMHIVKNNPKTLIDNFYHPMDMNNTNSTSNFENKLLLKLGCNILKNLNKRIKQLSK